MDLFSSLSRWRERFDSARERQQNQSLSKPTRLPSSICPIDGDGRRWLFAVFGGAVVAIAWPPRCDSGRRLAIGDVMLVAGCFGKPSDHFESEADIQAGISRARARSGAKAGNSVLATWGRRGRRDNRQTASAQDQASRKRRLIKGP